ncbi:MAG: alpha/beta fold hydrolase [Actinobacteria bacterium]|nr:alpha/beta fold hydrolase [Actinomycetota bacterium]
MHAVSAVPRALDVLDMAVGIAREAADDGARIGYSVLGDGAGLVLVHGITEQRPLWDPLLAALAERWRVVALDLRGHGAPDVHEVVRAADRCGLQPRPGRGARDLGQPVRHVARGARRRRRCAARWHPRAVPFAAR